MMPGLRDFDYALPSELVAQEPASRRDGSRLMVLDRSLKTIRHHIFRDIPEFLRPGDLLVLNDTKVVPARLIGRRRTGGRVEVFLLERAPAQETDSEYFKALIRPLGRLKTGETIIFKGGFSCRLADPHQKLVVFEGCRAADCMKVAGRLPLPPYIRREPTAADKERYQTVFARNEGAVAAPTAGLHFTRSLLSRLKKNGIDAVTLTLHVNFATFSPVRSEDIAAHRMAPESFDIPAQTIDALRRAKVSGRRVIAVGTTVTKTLEDSAGLILGEGPARRVSGESRLFIRPPYRFKIVDALVTNFHLPRTTLLMLVAAFAGRDLVLDAYAEAVRERYRFYSYGDAMLIV